MDQQDVADLKQLEVHLKHFSFSFKKPPVNLQQSIAKIQLSEDAFSQFLIILQNTFTSDIHDKKIYQLLKLIVQNQKQLAFFKSTDKLRKLYCQYLFGTFSNLEKKTHKKWLSTLRPLICVQSAEGSIKTKQNIFIAVSCFGPELKSIKQKIKDKLKEEFLVDIKNKPKNGLVFHQIFFTSGMLTNEEVVEITLAAQRLLKRSENNIETLLIILEQLSQTGADLSNHIKEIQDNLKELVTSNNFERSIKSLNFAYSLLHDEQSIKLAISFIQQLLTTTHDDAKKLVFVLLTKGLAKSITRLKEKEKVGQELLSLITQNCQIIQNENQLMELYNIANSIIELEIAPPEKDLPNYKKLLSLNKFSCSYISMIFLSYIKLKKEAVLEIDWFNDIAEAIFNQGVAQNLKNFAKVVTQTIMFLSALNFTCLYLYYCEEEAPQKLITQIHKILSSQSKTIFNSSSHLTKLNYLINPSCGQVESQMITDCLLLFYALNFEEFSENLNFDYFATLFTLIGFSNSKVKNSSNFKLSLIEKKLENTENGVQIFLQQIFQAFRVYIYNIQQQNDNIILRKNRFNQFIATLLREPAIKEAQNLDQIILSLSHPFISPKLLKRLQTFEIDFESNPDGEIRNIYFFLTELSKNNPYSKQSILNYTQFLIDMGIVEQVVEKVANIIDPEKLKEVLSLDQFEEELKKFQNSFKLDINWKPTFNGMGIEAVKEYVLEEISVVQLPKGKKQFLMDESEAQKHMSKKHKQRTLNFYQLILQYLQGFTKTSNTDIREWFFYNYFEQISSFCEDSEFRLSFFQFACKYFENYEITRTFKYTLAEFWISKATQNVFLELIPKFTQFQKKLVEKYSQKQIEHKSVVSAIHHSAIFTLQQNQFDLKNKELSMKFILNYANVSEQYCEKHLFECYEPLVQNINICAHVPLAFEFLKLLLNRNEDKANQYLRIFKNILNLATEAQKLSLQCLSLVDPKELPLDVGLYLKLQILAIHSDDEIAETILSKLPPFEQYIPFIKDWDYGEFVKNHAREHIEVMIKFLKDKVPKDSPAWKVIAEDNFQTAKFFEGAEEELLFYPYFLNICVEFLPEDSVPDMIDLILGQFANDLNRQQLMEAATQSGVQVIKYWGKKISKKFLPVIEKYMKVNQKQKDQQPISNSICAVIFLGILSPFLNASDDQLKDIQNKILQLFKTSSQKTQSSLAKHLPDLLSFFPEPMKMVESTYLQNRQESNQQSIRGNAYLMAGLIRAMGVNSLEEMKLLKKLEEGAGEKKESFESKMQVLITIEAIVDIMGRTIEPFILQIMNLLMKYYGDGKEEIRETAINATRIVMQKLTGYGVKTILPELLKGMEESKSWRGKIASIWALGNMAYCAPKQLSSRLPLIVSSISKAISDTHPQVRKSANESLELIGSTIQNPEISHIADILIRALSNPFDENLKGLEAILSTKFRHYIDAPALSLLIPIVDYALKSLDGKQKQSACNLIGNISALIKNKDDLIPYMDMIVGGLEVAIGDALGEVRSLAARAIGRISRKIGIDSAENYFRFVKDILSRSDVNAIKRAGASNAFAEMICSQNEEYYTESIAKIFELISRPEIHIKEGYIGVFISLPMIWRDKFQESVEEVVNNISEYISHEEDSIKNITLRVLKILIKNYGCDENELLYNALNENMMNVSWKRRNGAVILTGEMLQVTQETIKHQVDNPQEKQIINLDLYNQNLMLLYTLRQDEAEQVRHNSTQIWKQFIDNTPRCVKRALKYLVIGLASIINELQTVGVNTILNFCQKYGDSHMNQFLSHIQEILNQKSNLSLAQGAYKVLQNLYKYSDIDTLLKYNDLILSLSHSYALSEEQQIKKALFESVGEMVSKKSVKFLQEFIQPYMISFAKMEEDDPIYISHLDIFNHLCVLRNSQVLLYLMGLLLQMPIQQFKIDILTNNAYYFSKVVYTNHNEIIPMRILLDQLYASISNYRIDHDKIEWSPRTSSLLYCIGQISIELEEDQLMAFLEDLFEKFDLYQKNILNLECNEPEVQQQFPYFLATIETLLFCLNNTGKDFHIMNQKIITRIIPFLFTINQYLKTDQRQEIVTLVTKILICLNNTMDKDKHHKNLTQIHTSFFNRLRNNMEIPGLTTVEPFVQMLIDSFLFGDYERFSQACQLLDLLLDRCHPDEASLIKIVGSLIRLLSYKKYDKQQSLKLILKTQDFIQNFSVQLHVSYLKIANSAQDRPVLKQLGKNYSKLMISHPRRDITLKELFYKGIQSQSIEQQENLLKVTKTIIKSAREFELKSEELLFSMALLERIFVHAKQYFEKCLAEKSGSAYLAYQISYILSLTYKQASKQNQEKFKIQYLDNWDQKDSYQILIQLSFYRLLGYPDDANKLKTEALRIMSSSQDAEFVAQIARVVQKKGLDLGITRDILIQTIGLEMRQNSMAIQEAIK